MKKETTGISLSIAPMMDYTDRYFRRVLRGLTGETLLYSEMIHSSALVLGKRYDMIEVSPLEGSTVLQLGGNDPSHLREAAKMGEESGWHEINLNVGCPSSRVQSGHFGACLMMEPGLVRRCLEAMKEAVHIPVTVKHRIGVDEMDSYEDMLHFVDEVSQAEPERFTVHARKAWLKGLSPKENRNIPPIRYEDVWRLKRERPQLNIEINGHIKSMEEAKFQLEKVDAVMIGRSAYQTPWIFSEADSVIFGLEDPHENRVDYVRSLLPYLAEVVESGVKAHHVLRHLLGLYYGKPGAKYWKQHIAEAGTLGKDAPKAMEKLLDEIERRD